MKTKIFLLILILSIYSSITLFGQNIKVDSLMISLKSTKNDTARIDAYIGLCDAFSVSNPDTSVYFGEQGLKIAIKIKYNDGIANCYITIGYVHYIIGRYDKALNYYLKSLKIYEEAGNKIGIAKCHCNIGMIYQEQGSFYKALEYYIKSLKIYKNIGDKEGIAVCNICIGVIHDYKGCLALSDSDSLQAKKEYEKAIEYYFKSLKIYEEAGDKKSMAGCYCNVGIVYQEQENYNKALEYYLKPLKLYEETGNKTGIMACYINLASLNGTLSDAETLNKNKRLDYLNKAVEYGEKTLALAKETNSLSEQNMAANILMEANKKLGNYKKSIEYAYIFIATKDSMFSEDKTKALAGMEAKYQNEKKQLEIDKLNKEKELQVSENKKQKIIIFSVIGGLLLIVAFAIFVVNRLRITRKQKRLIENQRDEISAQRDEIEAQRDLVTTQKERIEEIHKEVTDSINYAKRIQEAVLPISIDARAVLGEHFVLFKPKDIVSGDFYWTTKVNNLQFIAVADCTGHGVPGAFMSMLGISFLSEIVSKQETTKASQVIDKLRIEIINALQQKGQSGEQKDGMDMTLCVINSLNNQLQYAGANNPLFIVTNQKELKVIEADKMPVAIHEHMENFTNHEYQLQMGDCIYLASDGYEDQFGGQKNKKFMSKQLKELLINISDKPMNEQHEILNTTFENWRGEHEQIDDVTILGLKI